MSTKIGTFHLEPVLSDDSSSISIRASAKFLIDELAKDLTVEGIINSLKQRNLAHYQLNHEHINELSERLLNIAKEINSEFDTEQYNFVSEPIAHAIDSTAEVAIDEDALEAVVTIKPAKGGLHLCKDDILELLKQNGVFFGIDEFAINNLLHLARLTDEPEVSAVIAKATMPVNGEDAKFIPLIETAAERILKPKLREDGTVDMRDLGDIPTVEAGEPVMRKEPPTKGTNGTNVYHEPIYAESGIDISFKPGKGTKIDEHDPNLLIATIDGQPNLKKRGMKVDDAIVVKAVDLSTGHLDVDANLIVRGDITEGMKVSSSGDITVGGVIESAEVQAQGNIIVGKGILGRTPDNSSHDAELSAKVEAGATVSAMFASYAEIKAQEDVLMAEQLLHCQTHAGQSVLVGNKKTVGSQIVGGKTSASNFIEADILGAPAGVKTYLDLSGRYLERSEDVKALRQEIEQKQQMLKNMQDAYSKFTAIKATPERQEHAQKIKNTINHLTYELKQLDEQLDEMKIEREAYCQGLAVKAKRKFRQNVELRVGRKVLNMSREREAGLMLYEHGEVKYQALKN